MAIVAEAQKREMRGAWIQCVNGQFQGMGKQRMQQTLTYQLDELKKERVEERRRERHHLSSPSRV